MKIGAINLAPAFGLAPMAGMTDTAFRRLVKRHGGCGLVVTEMVSSEGLVRGIDRTLAHAVLGTQVPSHRVGGVGSKVRCEDLGDARGDVHPWTGEPPRGG